MRYERWATCYDPDSKRHVFLAADGDKVGYVFGDGDLPRDIELHPVVAFTHTIQQLLEKFEAGSLPTSKSLGWLSFRLLRDANPRMHDLSERQIMH